jgi:N-methylhydantoinase B
MTVMIDGKAMNGRENSYIPDAVLKIDPSLQLFDEKANSVDPITYEVIRNNLWSINEVHGDTIVRVSGSPIAAFGFDFNPSIMTAAGDFIYFGPYLQFHSGMQDVQVKWILENRSQNPGIRDGDMFLSNDPWVGTCHQQDVMLCCPIFHEGKLFCWVANTLHFVDLGGATPGGWSPVATSVYDEPAPIPPLRIVEGGKIRRDIEEDFTRRSRLPQSVALDLRAVVAGNTVAKARILQLIQRYGAPVVAAVIGRILDDSEKIFLNRIASIPDGVWSERGYLEMANPGDRNVYRCELHVEKRGDQLTFRNHGTDPQAGALNITYAAWRGGILSVLNPFFCPDLLYAIGGPLRHMSFVPTPGTITCATYPGSVANGGGVGTELSISLANNCLAKMAHTSPHLRRFYTANNGITQWPIMSLAGMDQRGQPFQNMFLDWYAAPVGAYSFRDGIATGGVYWGPKQTAPNVEHTELVLPVLYFFRRELPNSGGAGRFTGGATLGISFTAHKTEKIVHQVAACGVSHPTSMGLAGGFAGPPNVYKFRRARDGERSVDFALKHLDSSHSLEVSDGVTRRLAPKESNLVQAPGDIYEALTCGAAGYGDPLDRDIESVESDVREGVYDEFNANLVFGAVFSHNPGGAAVVDKPATEERRRAVRRERLAKASPPVTPRPAVSIREIVLSLSDNLGVGRAVGGGFYFCSLKTRTALAPVDGCYKNGCPRLTLPLGASNPYVAEPREFVDEDFEFRLYLCPDSGAVIESEIARAADPPFVDVVLNPTTLVAMPVAAE